MIIANDVIKTIKKAHTGKNWRWKIFISNIDDYKNTNKVNLEKKQYKNYN